MGLAGAEDRSHDRDEAHHGAESDVVRGHPCLAPAAEHAQHDDEEPDHRVRPRGLLDRQPQDVQQHRNAEFSTPHADQPGGGAEDDPRGEGKGASPPERWG